MYGLLAVGFYCTSSVFVPVAFQPMEGALSTMAIYTNASSGSICCCLFWNCGDFSLSKLVESFYLCGLLYRAQAIFTAMTLMLVSCDLFFCLLWVCQTMCVVKMGDVTIYFFPPTPP